MKLDMEKLFPPVKAPNTTSKHKRTYDVRITLNKSGNNRQCIRFGLLNNAAAIASNHGFAEVSDIEYVKDRIYFRFPNSKESRTVHSLSRSTDSAISVACYFTITPSEKAEKQYRMNWIGKTYMLYYDSENELYYIENFKED